MASSAPRFKASTSRLSSLATDNTASARRTPPNSMGAGSPPASQTGTAADCSQLVFHVRKRWRLNWHLLSACTADLRELPGDNSEHRRADGVDNDLPDPAVAALHEDDKSEQRQDYAERKYG